MKKAQTALLLWGNIQLQKCHRKIVEEVSNWLSLLFTQWHQISCEMDGFMEEFLGVWKNKEGNFKVISVCCGLVEGLVWFKGLQYFRSLYCGSYIGICEKKSKVSSFYPAWSQFNLKFSFKWTSKVSFKHLKSFVQQPSLKFQQTFSSIFNFS